MRVKIKKWGNSFALRIPRSIVDDARLENESEVDVSVANGKIVLDPVPKAVMTLESLLAGVTDENKHREVETGQPVGNEAW
ncbi:MAG: AbrB/MazE/SpoVT family DNA-binding domain-containing protein [Candidatus Lokiarchaeota archaeon]|nr:AbrB/MazE/SpoVT family DNA-binding domain-containing protein [Candidatus Lokiarchaeota archaeon]